ncbi:hypothetical protein QBC35DRAFT_185031 [Podospora australis]|uniref:Uncharacterized protein n=1 Tax=Podospora australis TaxID=1536484 RepID=A0AAN6WVI5_9PEZI|nr:hypothetical protein QBC35DRAFT_185031 [Podospora australis]
MAPYLSVLTPRNDSNNSNHNVVPIVASIVGGIIVLVALVTALTLCQIRRRKFEKAKQRNPYLTKEEFMRRQKMSEADLFREQEHWRGHMIKKSLASRSSNSLRQTQSTQSTPSIPAAPVAPPAADMDQLEREICELERKESKKLKTDWKEWEARARHERSTSAPYPHPIAASNNPEVLPLVTMPNKTKRRSRDRFSWSSIPPLVPPRHPARRLRASHG